MAKKKEKKGAAKGGTELRQEIKFTNPLGGDGADRGDDAAEHPATTDESRRNLSDVPDRKKGTIGWLKRREEKQSVRVEEQNMNCKYDPNHHFDEGLLLLGTVKYSWAFCFKMGVKDDSLNEPSKADRASRESKLAERTSDLPDDHAIPLEAWQLCHRLWKHDFEIRHKVSMLGDKLLILVGLPYTLLLEEAARSRMNIRLIQTKGMHKFDKHMVELYPHGTVHVPSPFNSAHRQRLVLERMVRRAKLNPETMTTHRVKKKHHLDRLMHKHRDRKEIRGRHLIDLMNVYGAYRPYADKVIGSMVKSVSMAILEDQWMVLKAPENAGAGLSNAGNDALSYDDCGKALDELQAYHENEGQHEHFTGSFQAFFALHEPKTLAALQQRWGTFSAIGKMWVEEKQPEYAGMYSMHHPENVPVKQFSPLFQPIDVSSQAICQLLGLDI